MKRLALLPFLLFLLAADEKKPWPEKDDIFYVSAPLTSSRLTGSFLGGASVYNVDACTPFTMWKRTGEDRIYARDQRGAGHCFDGNWSALFHPTAKACTEKMKSDPAPSITMHGSCYQLH